MLLRRGLSQGDSGFTLVELLVAVFVLLVGALGAVAMMDGANTATASARDRVSANNLAREVIEAARAVNYYQLTPSAAPAALQAFPGLASSSGAVSPWTVIRGATKYTITVSPCEIDDGTDQYGSHANGNFCASSTQTGTQDKNPDDYRRMDVTVSWTSKGAAHTVRMTTLIINPSGGLGPGASGLCLSKAAGSTTCSGQSSVGPGAADAPFWVGSDAADTVHWSADSPNALGSATHTPSGSSTSWTFDWQLGDPNAYKSYTCGSQPSWVVDGTYRVTGQAFDSDGIPGEPSSMTLTINRAPPVQVCGLQGGYDAPPDKPGSPIVDLSWQANPERDIIGYDVYRVNDNKLVCSQRSGQLAQGTDLTHCWDSSPLPASGCPTVQYYVKALDLSSSGPASSNLTVNECGNSAPNTPPSLSASSSNGAAVLTWTAASPPDPDTGDSILFYRIYRDGTAYADRYDRTGDGATLTWSDPAPDGKAHNWWVTAVDNHYDESAPIGPVTQ